MGALVFDPPLPHSKKLYKSERTLKFGHLQFQNSDSIEIFFGGYIVKNLILDKKK